MNKKKLKNNKDNINNVEKSINSNNNLKELESQLNAKKISQKNTVLKLMNLINLIPIYEKRIKSLKIKQIEKVKIRKRKSKFFKNFEDDSREFKWVKIEKKELIKPINNLNFFSDNLNSNLEPKNSHIMDNELKDDDGDEFVSIFDDNDFNFTFNNCKSENYDDTYEEEEEDIQNFFSVI